nr:MAG TPA: hypothetical protein [Caudoviricetes sp.]
MRAKRRKKKSVVFTFPRERKSREITEKTSKGKRFP